MNILLIILELSSKFQISFSLNVLIIKLLIYFIIAACKFVFLWTFYGLDHLAQCYEQVRRFKVKQFILKMNWRWCIRPLKLPTASTVILYNMISDRTNYYPQFGIELDFLSKKILFHQTIALQLVLILSCCLASAFVHLQTSFFIPIFCSSMKRQKNC